jgi:hypothetical protein
MPLWKQSCVVRHVYRYFLYTADALYTHRIVRLRYDVKACELCSIFVYQLGDIELLVKVTLGEPTSQCRTERQQFSRF